MSTHHRAFRFIASLLIGLGLAAATAAAQYKVSNLVSSEAGKAKYQDTDMVNSWGVAYGPSTAFCVTDAGNGLATFYNASGEKQSQVITIPAAGAHHGNPTGVVYNNTSGFQISQNGNTAAATFIFDSIDGSISAWNSGVNANDAIMVINNSSSGASYTGLAIAVYQGATYIYAADHNNNKIDMYDSSFNLVQSFTDTNLPAGSNPFNVQEIQGNLYVAFTNPTTGGFVDIFTTGGTLIKTLASGKVLNGPWGLAIAPKNFGTASQTLLVGNLNNGLINSFNATTGALIGPLTTPQGKDISESGLWAVTFGGGTTETGKTNQLFFAAGIDNQKGGLFGAITYKK